MFDFLKLLANEVFMGLKSFQSFETIILRVYNKIKIYFSIGAFCLGDFQRSFRNQKNLKIKNCLRKN